MVDERDDSPEVSRYIRSQESGVAYPEARLLGRARPDARDSSGPSSVQAMEAAGFDSEDSQEGSWQRKAASVRTGLGRGRDGRASRGEPEPCRLQHRLGRTVGIRSRQKHLYGDL